MENKDTITGAEALLRTLIAEGAECIFGYPGGQAIPIYDSLYDYRDRLRHVLVRHEQGATHAAQGYARVSGRVGVALVTSGPGATNTITGVADAMLDSTPIVVITGQVPRRRSGMGRGSRLLHRLHRPTRPGRHRHLEGRAGGANGL